MGRRVSPLLIGASVVLAALVAILAALAFQSLNAPKLTGTSLGSKAAPDFHLRDSSGQAYSLDQFRGKVVVLTFLYTNCVDACPLTAELLRHADEAAGHPGDVVSLAVSVDPIGDTPANVAKFDSEHQMSEFGGRWHYLIGNGPDLQPVWQSYYMYAPAQPVPADVPNHGTGIYLIDKQGRERVFNDIDISAEDLARDELILAKQ